jgi:DNA polymerase-3 subunit beta
MKITCSRDNLLEGIITAQKAVSTRTTLPILQGILFDCRSGELRIMATDLELGIECEVDAEVIERGWIVLDSRLLGEIIRKLPPADVEISVDERNIAEIKCMNSCFNIQGKDGSEFPELSRVDGEKILKLPQDLIRSMIRQTAFACAVDETRPILTGALLESSGDEINMVALDGFRLALRTVKVESGTENISAVIPSKTLNEIYKILRDQQDKVNVELAGNQIMFTMGRTKVISRLLEGDFINYRQIIPDEHTTKVKVKTLDLLDSCERASLLAREGKNNLIKLIITADKMKITSNAEIGEVNEEISVITEGKDIEIAFNSKYLIDVLKVLESEYITLEFTTNVSPCIVRPVDSEIYVYMLLPVRVIA